MQLAFVTGKFLKHFNGLEWFQSNQTQNKPTTVTKLTFANLTIFSILYNSLNILHSYMHRFAVCLASVTVV